LPEDVIDRALSTSLETITQISGWGHQMLPVAMRGQSRVLRIESVRAAYFDALGARAVAGRFIWESDNQRGSPPVAVISERLRNAVFASDRVVGDEVRIKVAVVAIGIGSRTPRDVPPARTRQWRIINSVRT
jgi:hypothetical protein